MSGCAETVEAVPAPEDASEAVSTDAGAAYREIGPLRIEPGELDFGQVQAGVKLQGQVQLTNISNEPVRILKAKTSCGCTVASVPKEAFGPGESISVEVQFTPNGKPGARASKTVRFILEESENPIPLSVTAELVEFVRIEPAKLQLPLKEDQTITLHATDGETFKILAAEPEGAVTFSADGASVTQSLIVDHTVFDSAKPSRQLTISLDHPRVKSITIPVQRAKTVTRATSSNTFTPRARATGRIQTVPRRFNIGSVTIGDHAVRELLLRNVVASTGAGVSLELDSQLATAELIDATPTSYGLLLRIQLSPKSSAQGVLDGAKLRVRHGSAQAVVEVSGAVQAK
ncbi:MAG: DUF1573 domain-containing protein [Pseudomonadales bacterium]